MGIDIIRAINYKFFKVIFEDEMLCEYLMAKYETDIRSFLHYLGVPHGLFPEYVHDKSGCDLKNICEYLKQQLEFLEVREEDIHKRLWGKA